MELKSKQTPFSQTVRASGMYRESFVFRLQNLSGCGRSGEAIMREQPIHPRYGSDTPPVSDQLIRDTSPDTLKSLARKILKQGVSRVSPLRSDTPIHRPLKTDTPLIRERYTPELSESM